MLLRRAQAGHLRDSIDPPSLLVQSNGRAVDTAHADAMSLRNKQYQKLLEDHKKLNMAHAEQRELRRHQAGQLRDLQV